MHYCSLLPRPFNAIGKKSATKVHKTYMLTFFLFSPFFRIISWQVLTTFTWQCPPGRFPYYVISRCTPLYLKETLLHHDEVSIPLHIPTFSVIFIGKQLHHHHNHLPDVAHHDVFRILLHIPYIFRYIYLYSTASSSSRRSAWCQTFSVVRCISRQFPLYFKEN